MVYFPSQFVKAERGKKHHFCYKEDKEKFECNNSIDFAAGNFEDTISFTCLPIIDMCRFAPNNTTPGINPGVVVLKLVIIKLGLLLDLIGSWHPK